MPFIEVNQKKAYYEIHGDQEITLVILNGIMMSSASWLPFIKMLEKHVKVVLIDFFDQGKSDYLEANYTQEVQVELVHKVIKALDLKQVTLLGISYGGEVAMQYAIRYKSELDRLILANTTAYTNHQLKAIGDSWIYAAKTYDGKQFFKATIPPIYSMAFYERKIEWLEAREKLFVNLFDQKWYEGFIRLVISAEQHDERESLKEIDVPTLIIGADSDMITPVSCQEVLACNIKNARFLVIRNCGHAAMYEKPTEFFSAVLGFINTSEEIFDI